MTPEERSLLYKMAEQVSENNSMLRSIRSSMRWASIWKAIYWTLIIGTSIGAYWFIQPYIDQIMGVYSGAQSNFDSVKGLLDAYKQ